MGGRPTLSTSRDARAPLRPPLSVSKHSTLPGVACCPSASRYSTSVHNSTQSESSFNPTPRSTSVVRENRNTLSYWPSSCQGSPSESMPSVDSASGRTTEPSQKLFPTLKGLAPPSPIHRDSYKEPVHGLAPIANPSMSLGHQDVYGRTSSKHDEICIKYTQGQCSMGAFCYRKHIPPPAPPNVGLPPKPLLTFNEAVNSRHRSLAECMSDNKQMDRVSCQIQRNTPNVRNTNESQGTGPAEPMLGKNLDVQPQLVSTGQPLRKGPNDYPFNTTANQRPRWSARAIFRDGVCWDYMHGRCLREPRNCIYIHPQRYRWPKYMEKVDDYCRNYQQGRCILGKNCRFIHKEPETIAVSEKAIDRNSNSATAIAADPGAFVATISSADIKQEIAPYSEPPAGFTTRAPWTLIESKGMNPKVESTTSSAEAIVGQSTANSPRVTGKPDTTCRLGEAKVDMPSSIPSQQSAVQSLSATSRFCYSFAKGYCSRVSCPLLHPPPEEWHKSVENRYEICPAFETRGSCPRGIGCRFIHPPPVQSDTPGCATPTTCMDEKVASSKTARSGCSNSQIRDVDSRIPVKVPQPSSAPAKELAVQGTSEIEKSETLMSTRKGRKEPKASKKPSSLKENASENIAEKVAVPSTNVEKTAPAKGSNIPAGAPATKPGPLTSKQNVESVETSRSSSSGHVPHSSSSKGKQGRSTSKEKGKTSDPLKDKNKEKDRQPTDVKSVICLDYLAGHCSAEKCQRSHPKHPDQPESKPKKSINPASTTPKDDESTNRCSQTSERSLAAPAVPPGLGLEGKAELEPRPRPPPAMFTVFDSARVALGPGFEVKNLKTGFESRAVLLNAPVETEIAFVKQVLASFGEILDVQNLGLSKDPGMANFRAFFADHRDATRAVNTLQNTTPFGKPLDIKLGSRRSTALGGVFSDGEVELQFPAPGRTAFVGYQSKQDAETAMELARGIDMEGIRIRPMLHDGIPKVGTFTVRFDGLPPSWEPISLTWFGVNQGVMLKGFNYSHLDRALNSLHDTLQQFGDLDPISVLSEPTPQGLIRAWAHFKSPEAADRCCAELNGRKQRFIGGTKLYAKHVRSVRYHLSSEVYKAVTVDIRLARSQNCSRDHFCDIVVLDKHEPIIVKVVANEMSKLNQLKSCVEQVLRGYVLKENGVAVWDPFFVRAPGVVLLQRLQEKNAGVLIERNTRLRTITLFGPPHLRHIVEDSIIDTVRGLCRHQSRTFLLKSQLIPLFMSADLYKLQDELGHENVTFDLARRTLTVRGNEDAYQVVQLAILHASQRGGTKRRTQHNTCPVCFDDPSSPVTLSCGHTWCKSCLSSYLRASTDNRMFPLSCLGEEARCSQPILLEVAREVLSPREFESIVRTAATAYVESRSSEFHYCPTPDCPQVYRTVSHDKPLQCPSCLVRICPRCHSEYHEESACPELEKQHEVLFAEWSKDHDVKSCPGCKAPIERIAGCNHMTCTRCRTHICWVCMRTFSNTRNVYDHMHDVHGGIGL